jgi:NADH-quinone oxidoreductase subunit L
MNAEASELALELALIPLIPLIGFIINGLGFGKLNKTVAGWLGTLAALGSFANTLHVVLEHWGQSLTVDYFSWISVGSLDIHFSFLLDPLSSIMLLVITGVGSLIHIYSMSYMHHDEGFGKFFAFLNLFLFSMLLLVMGSNYVVMFIGWEGVGLCSFLLIGFWNKVPAYNAAARKAFVMNRIGDLGFLLGIFILIALFGSVEFGVIFPQAAAVLVPNSGVAIALTMLLFVGAMGKSAQLPLYTWLPDAMAGPTPVSALIHAATMVTAGIYMVVRSNVLYVLAPTTLEFVAWIGLATALIGAAIGLFQNDIKKVLAYSTVSQLGLMFLALGVGAFSSGMFHVVTHAFFKALLFLGAGSVIHAMSDEQDIRKMGGLKGKLPVTFAVFLIATIAISGIPPFAGFFSKDEILSHVYEHSKLMWGLGLLVSFMTSFYMFRLVFLTFFGGFRGTDHQKHHLHESPWLMLGPLVVLAGLSMAGGLLGLPPVLSHNNWMADTLAPIFEQAKAVNASLFGHGSMTHETEWMLMAVSTVVALVAFAVAAFTFGGGKNVPAADGSPINPVQKLVYNKFYIDELYGAVIVTPIKAFGEYLYAVIEYLIIDLVVNIVGWSATMGGKALRRLQTGIVSFYVLLMVLSVVVLALIGFTIKS